MQVPTVLVGIFITPEFSRQIFEKYSDIKFNFKKSVQLEPGCSLRTDGRTDVTKLAVAFRNAAHDRLCAVCG
jgi:hypothetical protein